MFLTLLSFDGSFFSLFSSTIVLVCGFSSLRCDCIFSFIKQDGFLKGFLSNITTDEGFYVLLYITGLSLSCLLGFNRIQNL